ncbi:hypothetical protein [Nitrosomonas sp. GH22]|uniref:hypothetical protein n=1 Tax=Nitrosomonas sp. GH22 TaxID=153947 RepID=UPI001F04531E|nr:hypothetical protein [Nitrosomonas sp. GH22]
MIDATLIESAARPKKTITLEMDAEDGYVRWVHTAPANQSEMVHFETTIVGAHIEANRVYADKSSVSQRQSAVSEKAQNQEHDHAPGIQEQTTLGTIKVNVQAVLKSICMNLKKAANKISVDEPFKRGAIRPNAAYG